MQVSELIPWRRRGPNWKTIAMSYEDALRVAKRKGMWMVNYLRARRDGDTLLAFYRSNYLAALRAREDGR